MLSETNNLGLYYLLKLKVLDKAKNVNYKAIIIHRSTLNLPDELTISNVCRQIFCLALTFLTFSHAISTFCIS